MITKKEAFQKQAICAAIKKLLIKLWYMHIVYNY